MGLFHVWLGRIIVTLGIINGGLGLKFANNSTRGVRITYGVLAGAIWTSYMAYAAVSEARERKSERKKEREGESAAKNRASGSTR